MIFSQKPFPITTVCCQKKWLLFAKKPTMLMLKCLIFISKSKICFKTQNFNLLFARKFFWKFFLLKFRRKLSSELPLVPLFSSFIFSWLKFVQKSLFELIDQHIATEKFSHVNPNVSQKEMCTSSSQRLLEAFHETWNLLKKLQTLTPAFYYQLCEVCRIYCDLHIKTFARAGRIYVKKLYKVSRLIVFYD